MQDAQLVSVAQALISAWVPVTLALTLAVALSLYHCVERKPVDIDPSMDIDYFMLSGAPLPRPLPDFDLDRAKPRPYRPFRWRYHQTMALAPLEHDWWIELESTYKFRVNQRQYLYTKHGSAVLQSMPGSEAACKEMMYMVIQFLCARYPNHFQFDKNTCGFTNRILGTSDDIDTVHPLQFLLNNVPEDFLVTQKDPGTGEYFLRAAVCCSAIGFNMTGKMGRPLREIHGPVPDYEWKLKTSVDKFFDRMPVEKPIQRGSWSFEVGQPLYLQANDPEYMEHKRENPNLRIEDVYLRIDWQTLRRLPQSKAILFNFKALFTPVTQLQEEPYIPQLILKVLKEGPASIKKYKGWSHLEHRLLPALEVYARDQVSRGLVPEGWQERTLDEQPFFPGWQSVSG